MIGLFCSLLYSVICEWPLRFGWSHGSTLGFISTNLKKDSNKCGRLDFGNCWHNGKVGVYLNGELISEAERNTPRKIVEFPIKYDSMLEIRDHGPGNSVIKITKFEMVPCNTSKKFFIIFEKVF